MAKADDIAYRVRKIIVDHLGVDMSKVTDDAKLHDHLGADSLDDVELVMTCEEGFGIEIDDEAINDIETVGDVIALVRKAVA